MHVHSMDLKDAFRNSKLEHEIFMAQPEGFVDRSKPDYVGQLRKAVYGLKQSLQQWYGTIKPVLESVGVNASRSEIGLLSGTVKGALVLLGIYVDDLFFACKSLPVLDEIKSTLSSTFSMKDLRVINHYLGMDITYNFELGEVVISQSHFLRKILNRLSMSRCKPSPTPMQAKLLLRPHDEDETPFTSVLYRQIIGSLIYFMLCTRPDIAFSIGVLSKF